MDRLSVFQKTKKQHNEIYDIPYYKMMEKYIRFLGQDPRQKNEFRNIIVFILVISIASILIPTTLELYISLRNKDMDGVIECIPHFIASSISAVKLLNLHFNRQNYNILFHFVIKKWQQLKSIYELNALDETIMQGKRMAKLYRISPILDIVHPLNQTRSRQQLLRVNYIIFDTDDYFFYIYLQLAWGSIIVVLTIIAADWFYILIIHFNSGLFAVCGVQVLEATMNSNLVSKDAFSENSSYEKFRTCVIMHNEVIEFYNILNENCQYSYLIQVGLNMLGMSTTAVQTVINLDRPDVAIRSAVFFGANQFHLFLLSLPGQILLDHCADFANAIYDTTWYGTSLEIQKMLYMMQIRSKKLCALTAGGLYDMNIENFGITFKTCMSYFTMIMSLK
ncbi:odorant receptor 63a-like isoform X3 [Apis mellifera]|uniref:Odorant receptor n=1 Tax=Apis mellifera TaxID=7460 RepID=A0A7M7IPG4_APIME|nr:odorant receptor 63a-like isoform X3 [Apis mellifera]|eukprot:XP_016770783.1 odorant receptor 63a-like isoform X3 [Apis mellifera]